MEQLKNNPDLSIQEVSDKTGLSRKQLRDEQLYMLRKNVPRDKSGLWKLPNYGRVDGAV